MSVGRHRRTSAPTPTGYEICAVAGDTTVHQTNCEAGGIAVAAAADTGITIATATDSDGDNANDFADDIIGDDFATRVAVRAVSGTDNADKGAWVVATPNPLPAGNPPRTPLDVAVANTGDNSASVGITVTWGDPLSGTTTPDDYTICVIAGFAVGDITDDNCSEDTASLATAVETADADARSIDLSNAAILGGTGYVIGVRADHADDGNSAWATAGPITTTRATFPSAPTITSATGGDGEYIISWTPPTDTGTNADGTAATIASYRVWAQVTDTSLELGFFERGSGTADSVIETHDAALSTMNVSLPVGNYRELFIGVAARNGVTAEQDDRPVRFQEDLGAIGFWEVDGARGKVLSQPPAPAAGLPYPPGAVDARAAVGTEIGLRVDWITALLFDRAEPTRTEVCILTTTTTPTATDFDNDCNPGNTQIEGYKRDGSVLTTRHLTSRDFLTVTLDPMTTYYFGVRYLLADDTASEWSISQAVSPNVPPPHPDNPTEVYAAPSDGGIIISWTASGGETAAEGYQLCAVERRQPDWTDGTASSLCQVTRRFHEVEATVTEYTLTSTEINDGAGLRNGVLFYTGVRAFIGDAANRLYSDWVPTTPATVTPSSAEPPTIPLDVQVARGTTANQIEVTWGATGIGTTPTGYEVCAVAAGTTVNQANCSVASDGGIAVAGATDTSITLYTALDSDADGNNDFAANVIGDDIATRVAVRAVADTRRSGWVIATPDPLPAGDPPREPSITAVSVGDASVSVAWDAPADGTTPDGYTLCVVAGFEVAEISDANCTADATETALGSERTATLSGDDFAAIANDEAVVIGLRADHASEGSSRWVSGGPVVPMVGGAPATPGGFTVTAGDEEFTYRWEAPASGTTRPTGYTVCFIGGSDLSAISDTGCDAGNSTEADADDTSITIGVGDGFTVTNGQEYVAGIRADHSTAGNSGWATFGPVTPMDAPPATAPEDVTIEQTFVSGFSVSFTLPSSGTVSTEYEICALPSTVTEAFSDTTCTEARKVAISDPVSGVRENVLAGDGIELDAGVSYRIAMRATHSDGNSAWAESSPATVTPLATLAAPGAPSAVMTSAGLETDSINVNWTAPSGGTTPTGYTICAIASADVSDRLLSNFDATNCAAGDITTTSGFATNAILTSANISNGITGGNGYLVAVRADTVTADSSAWAANTDSGGVIVVTPTAAVDMSDATLSSLTISPTTTALSPAFAADTTGYTANIAAGGDFTVTAAATGGDDGATVMVTATGGTVGGTASPWTITPSADSITVTVTVTAGDGSTTADYVVTVMRDTPPDTPATPASSDASLMSLSLSAGSLSPVFVSDTYTYTADVGNAVSGVTVSAEANHNEATVAVVGGANLVVGANTITITVTAEDGTSGVYTVTVNRLEPPGFRTTTLSSLTLSGIDISFTPNTNSYSVTVPYARMTTTVAAVPSNERATFSGGGVTNLEVGVNTITITVTAEDTTTTRDYVVTVTRLAKPAISIVATSATVTEGVGAMVSFTVSSDMPVPADIMVTVTLRNADRFVDAGERTKSVTITATEPTVTVSFAIDNDDVVEPDTTNADARISFSSTVVDGNGDFDTVTVLDDDRRDATLRDLILAVVGETNPVEFRTAFDPDATEYEAVIDFVDNATGEVTPVDITVTATESQGMATTEITFDGRMVASSDATNDMATATVTIPDEEQYEIVITVMPVDDMAADREYTLTINPGGGTVPAAAVMSLPSVTRAVSDAIGSAIVGRIDAVNAGVGVPGGVGGVNLAAMPSDNDIADFLQRHFEPMANDGVDIKRLLADNDFVLPLSTPATIPAATGRWRYGRAAAGKTSTATTTTPPSTAT